MKTASGATAVQIARKVAGRREILEHVGSAHDEAELAVLMHVAHEHLHVEGQQVFDFGDGTAGAGADGAQALRVVGSASRVLWEVLEAAWEQLGLGVIADEAFKQLVFARLIEPASKRDTVRILKEIGVCSIHLSTVKRCLKRVVERDYRAILDGVFHQHALATGGLALCLYDVSTLYFEAENEDELRRVGYSKERRVDPQVVVGLLVDSRGFPLQIRAFPGNKAETHTLLPVLDAYKKLHGIDDLIVVADAGMLSDANLTRLEAAGYRFIVGNRSRKTNDDLLPHYTQHGLVLTDGQVVEATSLFGTTRRRVVYQFSAKRYRRDNITLNKQIERARAVQAGEKHPKGTRFVKTRGGKPIVDEDAIQQARNTAGIKGYVTNLPIELMDGAEVITQYHQLWRVEQSFRMSKHDLAARPMYHHDADAINAHLTIVYAALALARHLQAATGKSLKTIITTLRPLRDITIEISGHQLTAKPDIPDTTHTLITNITGH